MKYSPIDYYRSVRIEESSEGDTTTFKVIVDAELFGYKTEEEIADMIYRTIQNALKGV